MLRRDGLDANRLLMTEDDQGRMRMTNRLAGAEVCPVCLHALGHVAMQCPYCQTMVHVLCLMHTWRVEQPTQVRHSDIMCRNCWEQD